MPVTALGDVAKAALAAKFAEVHGPWKLHVTAREALVVYLAARGEGVPRWLERIVSFGTTVYYSE